jgi:hypothetical protein
VAQTNVLAKDRCEILASGVYRKSDIAPLPGDYIRLHVLMPK